MCKALILSAGVFFLSFSGLLRAENPPVGTVPSLPPPFSSQNSAHPLPVEGLWVGEGANRLPALIKNWDVGQNGIEIESSVLAQPSLMPLALSEAFYVQAMARVARQPVEILLNNGQQLKGRLTEIGERFLVLEPLWSAPLKVDRRMVAQVLFYPSPQFLTLPEDADSSWILDSKQGQSPQKWIYEDLAFTGPDNTLMYSNFSLPDKLHVSFWVECKDEFNFSIALWQEKGASPFQNSWMFNIGSNRVFPQNFAEGNKRIRRRPLEYSPTHFSIKKGAEGYRVDLFADKEQERFFLYVDGELFWEKLASGKEEKEEKEAEKSLKPDLPVKTEQKPAPVYQLGLGVEASRKVYSTFYSQISVEPWDGVALGKEIYPHAGLGSKRVERDNKDFLSLRGDYRVETRPPETLLFEFKNGDVLQGKIRGSEGENLLIEKGEKTLKVPFARLKVVDFLAEGKQVIPRLMKSDVFFMMRDGSRFVAQPRAFSAGKLRVYSEAFGEQELKLSEVYKMKFNLYKKKK